MHIQAQPYPFPLQGEFSPETTALMVIDMQGDFCAENGYMHRYGFDLTALRRPIPVIASLLTAFRANGFHVIHTRETFSADLSDVQPHRLWRGINGRGIAVGDTGPTGRHLIKDEPCWQIIPELAPLDHEVVFDKSAYGAFGCTSIDAYLRECGIRALVMTGLTSDCCIHTNVREALDRGYDCLTVADATGACLENVHAAAIKLLIKKSGVFGSVCNSSEILIALQSVMQHAEPP